MKPCNVLRHGLVVSAVALTGAASAQSGAPAAAPATAPAQGPSTTTVTIYGVVDVSVRHATHYGPSASTYNSVGDAIWAPSRLGFRGTEDLGDGYKGIFLIEQGFDPSSGTLTMATTSPNYGVGATQGGRAWGRESWVGLVTPMGTVTLGRQYTLAHQLSGRFQPSPNPNLDAISGFSVHHVARQDNMVKYQYTAGPAAFLATVTASEGNGKAWAVGTSYTGGPFDVAAYWQQMDSFNGAETRKILGLGGTYKFTGSLKGMVGYMKRTHRVSAQENDVYSLGVNYRATESLTLLANFLLDSQRKVGIGKRRMAYVAADYALSKRTGLYAEVDRNQLTDLYPTTTFMAVRGTQYGVTTGIRHRF